VGATEPFAESTLRASTLLLLVLLLPALQAQAQNRAARRLAYDVVDDVRALVAARDCGAAVQRLRDGMTEARPEVALLAGSMYENGICVKRSWDHAMTFYTQAYRGGLPEAALRLAAGYADPAQGPDVAAALWWNQRDDGGLRYPACAVGKDAEQDPDRFVAELRRWDPARLAICNYIVGVVSAISADVKYPRLSQAWAMDGEATLRFLPALPRIDLKQGPKGQFRPAGWRDGDAAGAREAGPAAEGFETAFRESARRALSRYPQPAGIRAGLEVQLRYVFVIEE
jgi:hypothetical protein